MNQKKYNIWMLAMTVFAVIVTVLANVFADVHILPMVNRVLVPIAFIVTLVMAYFSFQDKISFENKWIWASIAVQAGMVLRNLGNALGLLGHPESPVLPIVSVVLSVAGGAAVVTALLNKKLFHYLPYAFGAFALSAILYAVDADFAPVEIAQILLYAVFSVITLNVLPMCNRLLRVLAVVFAVISVPSLGLTMALSWIILAFELVPAVKCNFRLTFGKLAAILCVITAFFALFAFVKSEPLAVIRYSKEQIVLTQEKIEETEKEIEKTTTSITKYNSQLEQKQTDLTDAEGKLTEAETVLQDANANVQKAEKKLATVCKRSSYSYWYCSGDCRSLHVVVDNSKSEASDAEAIVFDCQNEVEIIEDQIEDIKHDIENGENKISQLEEEIGSLEENVADYCSGQVSNWFTVVMGAISTLLCAGAIVCLAACLFKLRYGKLAFISCGALAAGALLYLLLGSASIQPGFDMMAMQPEFMQSVSCIVYLIQSSYFWTIVIAGLLAVIFVKKEGKLVKYRVFMIIAAVLAAVTSGSAAGILFAVTMIVTALVLVPPVFTEEIGIAKHIFFTIISLGIWMLIWIYHVTKNLNKVTGVKHRTPGKELLLCIFLPLYYAFWLMKTGEYIEAYARENGKHCKLEIICLVFACIIPFISTILIQNKINMIVEKAE